MKKLSDSMSNILRTLAEGHSIPQIFNYVRYILSGNGEVLKYSPITISIVATSRCTLSCEMCPTHSGRVPDDYMHAQQDVVDMSLETFRDIIDRFASATTVHIIGSGEPLLNKDFFRMVDYAAGKRMTVKTFSNGTTVRRNIDNILRSGLEGITISINGHDPAEFSRMTGMDAKVYEEICGAVKALVDEKKRTGSKVKVKLSYIIDKGNYRHIPDMVSRSLELGADHTFFCNFLPAPFEGLRAEDRQLSADRKTADDIRAIFRSYPLSVRKKLTPPVLVDSGKRENRCRTHFSQIRFDGNGNVSSCSMMLLNMSGNGSYLDKDVWNNGFFRKMRRAFLSADGGLLPEPCRNCPDNKGVSISA